MGVQPRGYSPGGVQAWRMQAQGGAHLGVKVQGMQTCGVLTQWVQPWRGAVLEDATGGVQTLGVQVQGCIPRGYRPGCAVLEGCRPGCVNGGADPGGAGLGGSILVLTLSYLSLPDCVQGTQLWNAPAPHPPFVNFRFCVGEVTRVWRTGNHAQASGALSAHPCAQKLCGISLHELGVFRIIPAGEEKKNTNLIHNGNAMTFPLFLEENERMI